MSRTSTTGLALLALVVTFAAGVVAGVAGDRIFRRPPHVPEFATRAMVARLSRHLDLDDAQRAKVTEILERRHARINSIFGGVRPRVHEEIDQANREIAQVLTAEQRAKFERMKIRMRHGDRPRLRDSD